MRARFPRFCLGAFGLAVSLAMTGSARAAPTDEPRGGRVGWGRMITSSPYWNFHSDRDPGLASFIRNETTLNIDPSWSSVSPTRLDQLCRFPLIYVKDLAFVRTEIELKNIKEYLQRGGFLCIDACITAPRTPDLEAYFRENSAILQRLVPGAEVKQLPEAHTIYHCYFNLRRDDIFPPEAHPLTPGKHDGLYGVFDGQRMIAVISMYGLECGWPEEPKRKPGCMKAIVNIYVYAMTRGAEARP